MTALVWSSLLSTVCTASSHEFVSEESLMMMIMRIMMMFMIMMLTVVTITSKMPETGGSIASEHGAVDDIDRVEGESPGHHCCHH